MPAGRRSIAVLLAVAAMAALPGCQAKNEFVAPPPPEVTVAQPITRPLADVVEFTGTTQASSHVDLKSRVNGYLQRLEFTDGAWVQEGQLLFVIEPRPFEVALDAAKAELMKAQAALQLEEADYARIEPLAKNRTVTQAEFDVQKAQLATAQANVAAAESAVERAELDLSYTEIRSPISGRAGRHMVDPGNLVQAETTLLGTVENMQPIHVYFNVSESDVLRFMELVRTKQIPDPEKEPPKLQLSLGNGAPFAYDGVLDYRSSKVDTNTGTALRRGLFANPDRSLIPGLFVRVRSTLGQPRPRLLVDERAVGADQRGEYVLVVNDKNIVEQRPVTLGMRSDGMRTLESGVNPGEWIVVNGLQRARPGAPVAPVKSEMAAFAKSQAAEATQTSTAQASSGKSGG